MPKIPLPTQPTRRGCHGARQKERRRTHMDLITIFRDLMGPFQSPLLMRGGSKRVQIQGRFREVREAYYKYVDRSDEKSDAVDGPFSVTPEAETQQTHPKAQPPRHMHSSIN